MLVFSSSCAMKKVVLRYLDVGQSVPAKAWTGNSKQSSSVELCKQQAKSGSLLDDVDLYPAQETAQVPAPLFYLLASFLFSYLAISWLSSLAAHGRRQYFLSYAQVPIYLQLKQLVYYD